MCGQVKVRSCGISTNVIFHQDIKNIGLIDQMNKIDLINIANIANIANIVNIDQIDQPQSLRGSIALPSSLQRSA